MTKFKGQAASFAPAMASVCSGISAFALGAILNLIGTTAQAGSCAFVSVGVFECSGAVNSATDTGQTFNSAGDLTVTTQAGFGLDSSGNGLSLRGNSITFTDSNMSSISGGPGQGINARSYGPLSITSTGTISGGLDGIDAYNRGGGALAISVVNASGGVREGIFAYNTGTDLTVTSTGTVTGGLRGIGALNLGSGALTISAASASGSDVGIGVYNSAAGTDMTITTSGPVQGRTGISAQSLGSGALTISTSDTTTGSGNGIAASTGGAGTSLSISANGAVSGGLNGMVATNNGSGALTISATDVTGTAANGIFAQNSGNGTTLSITTTGAVQGGAAGISTNNQGSGTSTLRVSGSVTGGTGAGIETSSGAGRLSVIDLQSGASVSSASGDAITNNEGDSQVMLRAGSAVAGAVRLSDGMDQVTVEGGADLSAATLIDGGDGVLDNLTFDGFSGTFDTLTFANWETLNADNGSDLTLNKAAAGFAALNIRNGSAVTVANAGFSMGGDLTVDPTGRFLVATGGAGNIAISGNAFNNGLISLADGHSGDRLIVGGNLSGAGTIALDVNLATGENDQLQVTGNSAGATQGLRVDKSGSGDGAMRVFTLVTVGGASTGSDFQIVNADFVTNGGQQAISDGQVAYVLEYDAATGEFFLSPFDNSGGINTNPGGDFLAGAVQQFSDHIRLDGALRRLLGRSNPSEATGANTVSRALSDLSTTDTPLFWFEAKGGRDSYTSGDRDVDTSGGGVRIGAGLPLAEIGSGRIFGGLEFGAANLSTTVATPLATGDVETDAYDLTLSVLWVGDSRAYVDTQLRYAYFDSATRATGGAAQDTDGNGYGFSIEVGKAFTLQNGLNLIPQAQFIYSDIDIDSFADPTGGGLAGSLADGDTLTARLGLRAEYELGIQSLIYGQLDYYHAFDNSTGVSFGQNTILTVRNKDTAALTLGGQIAVANKTTLYGEVSGTSSFGGDSNDNGFTGTLGFEISF